MDNNELKRKIQLNKEKLERNRILNLYLFLNDDHLSFENSINYSAGDFWKIVDHQRDLANLEKIATIKFEKDEIAIVQEVSFLIRKYFKSSRILLSHGAMCGAGFSWLNVSLNQFLLNADTFFKVRKYDFNLLLVDQKRNSLLGISEDEYELEVFFGSVPVSA